MATVATPVDLRASRNFDKIRSRWRQTPIASSRAQDRAVKGPRCRAFTSGEVQTLRDLVPTLFAVLRSGTRLRRAVDVRCAVDLCRRSIARFST
jgi:hypothetical protein